MCRKELEKQELEIEKKNSVIQQYKGITSRLSQKLEQLQTVNDNTTVCIDRWCPDRISLSSTSFQVSSNVDSTDSKPSEADGRVRQIQELELELARTKLSKVESECKVQVCELGTVRSIDLQPSALIINAYLPRTWNTNSRLL